MSQKSGTKQSHGEIVVKEIRRATRKQYSAEENDQDRSRWPEGRGQHCGAVPSRGHRPVSVLQLVQGILGSGKKRLAGDTPRAATSTEVKDLRREACDLKKVVAEQAP